MMNNDGNWWDYGDIDLDKAKAVLQEIYGEADVVSIGSGLMAIRSAMNDLRVRALVRKLRSEIKDDAVSNETKEICVALHNTLDGYAYGKTKRVAKIDQHFYKCVGQKLTKVGSIVILRNTMRKCNRALLSQLTDNESMKMANEIMKWNEFLKDLYTLNWVAKVAILTLDDSVNAMTNHYFHTSIPDHGTLQHGIDTSILTDAYMVNLDKLLKKIIEMKKSIQAKDRVEEQLAETLEKIEALNTSLK